MASKITDNLYLGTYYDAMDLDWLKSHNITHIVNASMGSNYYPERIKYYKIDVYDDSKSNISIYFEKSSEFIDKAICAGGKSEMGKDYQVGNVLVHCMAGKSRSPTLVVAYLVSKKGMTLDEALQLVKQNRPIIRINLGFVEQLREKFSANYYSTCQ